MSMSEWQFSKYQGQVQLSSSKRKETFKSIYPASCIKLQQDSLGMFVVSKNYPAFTR